MHSKGFCCTCCSCCVHCSDAALRAEPGGQRVPHALQPVAEAAGRERQEYHQRQDQASHLVCICKMSRVYYECRLRSAAARSLMNKFSAGLHFFETAYRDVVTGWWAILMYAYVVRFLVHVSSPSSFSRRGLQQIRFLYSVHTEQFPLAPQCVHYASARNGVINSWIWNE